MKRIDRDHPKFDIVKLVDRFARSRGTSIGDEAVHDEFVAGLSAELEASRSSGTLLHGLHNEKRFAYVAAALGNCSAIKQEDSGEVYAESADVCTPDFRIVTLDGLELLVEVKNHHPRDPGKDFTLKREYLESLERYARVFQRDLYIAVYWSRWGIWSLVQPKRFESEGDILRLGLGEAVKASEMKLLGDRMLGTVPPLALKLVADPEKPRLIGQDGRAQLTIKTAELLAAGRVIDDSLEKQIAWFLLHYGDWSGESGGMPAEVVDGEVVSFSVEAWPNELDGEEGVGQRFEVIGWMSQMISREFNRLTANSGGVDLLVPDRSPDALGVLIPRDFRGEVLRLWQFTQEPSAPDDLGERSAKRAPEGAGQ